MPIGELLPALVGWGVASLFLLGLALALQPPLRLGRRRVDLLVTGFLFLFLTTLLVLACGLSGWLRPTPIFLLSLVGLAAGWGWHRAGGPHPANPWSRLLEAAAALRRIRPPAAPWPPTDAAIRVVLGLLVAAQVARLAVHVWVLPPYVWDALSYHLPKVAEWVQQGRLAIFETPVPRTFWPANFELFQTWFALFPHHDFLLDAAGIPFYLLAVGSVYAMARSLEVDRRPAVFAALIYAYTPAVALHATGGKNDLPIAALYLFCLAVLLDARGRRDRWPQRLVVVWLALALAAGTKAYIAFIAPGLLLLAAWSWRRERRPDVAGAARRPGAASYALAGGAGLLLAGYWYARNLALFGNPFYPVSLRLFGRLLAGTGEGRDQLGGVSLAALWTNFEILAREKIFDSLDVFSVSLNNVSGWGWFVFAFLPVLAWGIVSRTRIRWLAAGFLLSLASLFATVAPDPWNLRFALWFPALSAVAFAVVIPNLRIQALRGALYALAVLCLALNFAGTLDVGRLSPSVWRHMAGLSVWERSTANLGFLIGGSYGQALARVPPDEVLGYNVGPYGWIYPLYDADLSRRIRYVPLGAAEGAAAAMRRRGVRVLFVSRTFPHEMPAVEERLSRDGLRRIGDGLFVRQD